MGQVVDHDGEEEEDLGRLDDYLIALFFAMIASN